MVANRKAQTAVELGTVCYAVNMVSVDRRGGGGLCYFSSDCLGLHCCIKATICCCSTISSYLYSMVVRRDRRLLSQGNGELCMYEIGTIEGIGERNVENK